MTDALNETQRSQLKLLVELDPFFAQEVVHGALVRRVMQAEARAIEARNAVTAAIGLKGYRGPKDCPTRQALVNSVLSVIEGGSCELEKRFVEVSK